MWDSAQVPPSARLSTAWSRVNGWDLLLRSWTRRAGDPPKLIGDPPCRLVLTSAGRPTIGVEEILTSAWEGWQAVLARSPSPAPEYLSVATPASFLEGNEAGACIVERR